MENNILDTINKENSTTDNSENFVIPQKKKKSVTAKPKEKTDDLKANLHTEKNQQGDTPQKHKKSKKEEENNPPPKTPNNTIWLAVSEAAKLGGVQTKTIRRAIQSNKVTYKIIKNRYLIEFTSIIRFLYTTTKLKNKLFEYGIGQYIDKWKQDNDTQPKSSDKDL